MNLSAETIDRIHRLWDDLVAFDVAQSDEAARHLMRGLAEMVRADNAIWIAGVRLRNEPRDPMLGWRVPVTLLLHHNARQEQSIAAKQRKWNQREKSPTFRQALELVERYSSWSYRKVMPPEWFESEYFKANWGELGVHDMAFVSFPVNALALSCFGFHRIRIKEDYSEQDMELLSYALSGIMWFHHKLMLSHGLMVASAPLTPAERRVLQLLLTDASEKEIAKRLDIAFVTVHGHVRSVYRKFNVGSRPGLMSLWLSGL